MVYNTKKHKAVRKIVQENQPKIAVPGTQKGVNNGFGSGSSKGKK